MLCDVLRAPQFSFPVGDKTLRNLWITTSWAEVDGFGSVRVVQKSQMMLQAQTFREPETERRALTHRADNQSLRVY